MDLRKLIFSILQMVQFKGADRRKIEFFEREARDAKRANIDLLEEVKLELSTLHRRIRSKNEDRREANDKTMKAIFEREIGRLFEEVDRLNQREKIIGRNISQAGLVLGKIAELKDAAHHGVGEDTLDTIAVDIQDAFEELHVADRTAVGLESVRYVAPHREPLDTAARVAALEAESDVTEIPDDLLRRLEELEQDPE